MVAEVNKIICGELLAHRAVVIPGTGALCVIHRSARRLSRRQIAAPYNEIEFRSNEEGTSLVDLIRRAAGCDGIEARMIFDRWLAKVRDGEVLTLEGIGVLRHRSFVPEKEFAARLNPLADEIVTLRPRMNRFVVATAVVAVLIAAGVFGYLQFGTGVEALWGRRAEVRRISDQPHDVSTPARPESVSTPVGEHGTAESLRPASAGEHIPSEGGNDVALAPEASSAVVQQPVATTGTTASTASESAAAGRNNVPNGSGQAVSTGEPVSDRMQSGWSYVVYGVFSTEENAARCRDELLRKNPSITVAVYPFGSKYMVTPCASRDRSACERYASEHRDVWPDLWIYSKK